MRYYIPKIAKSKLKETANEKKLNKRVKITFNCSNCKTTITTNNEWEDHHKLPKLWKARDIRISQSHVRENQLFSCSEKCRTELDIKFPLKPIWDTFA